MSGETEDQSAEPSDAEQTTQFLALKSGIGEMPFGRDEWLTSHQCEKKRQARDLFKKAYESQMQGELSEAADLYKESLKAYPTAEAHTFLGWTYSFQGLTDEAIEECLLAIEVDPDFGNPYNDIGAYLIEKGEMIGAIEWLKRAMRSGRYESYYYPHFNLGRVYEARGQLFKALREYKTAIDLNPKYGLAVAAFRKLQARLN